MIKSIKIYNLFSSFFLTCILISSFTSNAQDSLQYAAETHFRNIRQLTFGGDNAEAYFSFDGKWLVFQKTYAKEGIPCDQIYVGKIPEKAGEKFEPRLVSTGKGRTTCGAFLKDNKHVVFASTHHMNEACPPVPDSAKYGNKYIWPLYPEYDIFIADLNGKITKQLTNNPGYDAEATISPDGKTMLFTSTRDGDIDLYTMDLKSGKVKRLTNQIGYEAAHGLVRMVRKSSGGHLVPKLKVRLRSTRIC